MKIKLHFAFTWQKNRCVDCDPALRENSGGPTIEATANQTLQSMDQTITGYSIAGLASYIIHDEISNNRHKTDRRRKYIVELATQLVIPLMEARAQIQR